MQILYDESNFSRKHDTILWYSKSKKYKFNSVYVPKDSCLLCGESISKRNNMKRSVDSDGRVYRTIKSNGKIYKYYDDDPVLLSDVWLDIGHLQQKDPERTGYPTQKRRRIA